MGQADVEVVGPEDFLAVLGQGGKAAVVHVDRNRGGGLGVAEGGYHVAFMVEVVVGDAFGEGINHQMGLAGVDQRIQETGALLHLHHQRPLADVDRHGEFDQRRGPAQYILVPGAQDLGDFVIDLGFDIQLLLVHGQIGFQHPAVADHDLAEIGVGAMAKAGTRQGDHVTGLQGGDGARVGAGPDLGTVDRQGVDDRRREYGSGGGARVFTQLIEIAQAILFGEVTGGLTGGKRHCQRGDPEDFILVHGRYPEWAVRATVRGPMLAECLKPHGNAPLH